MWNANKRTVVLAAAFLRHNALKRAKRDMRNDKGKYLWRKYVRNKSKCTKSKKILEIQGELNLKIHSCEIFLNIAFSDMDSSSGQYIIRWTKLCVYACVS